MNRQLVHPFCWRKVTGRADCDVQWSVCEDLRVTDSSEANPLGLPDVAQLPYLLRLLDDESAVVREAVRRELTAFGPGLGDALAELHTPLDRSQSARLQMLLSETAAEELRCRWRAWQSLDAPLEQLEVAMEMIADFQDHTHAVLSGEGLRPLGCLLDELSESFLARQGSGDALALAEFLFQERSITGAVKDYYDPRNSNLRQVVARRVGIPITLSALYMLVGGRLGMEITGCNWPGHFLSRVRVEGRLVLVDCFNEGRPIEVEAFLSTQGPSRVAARKVLEEDAGIPVMIGRVVNNLVRAYQESGHWAYSHLMLGLLRETERYLQDELRR